MNYLLEYYQSLGYADSEKYRFFVAQIKGACQIFRRLVADWGKNGHFWPFFMTKYFDNHFQRANKSKLKHSDCCLIPLIITCDMYFQKNTKSLTG